jgi:hypothetical protein
MPPVITESDRKTDSRGVAPPPWATEPPVWGEPVKGEPPGWDKVRRDLAEMERKKVFRYARPDGSQLETTWVNESSAKVWAEMNGLRYLGRVPDRTETPAPPPPDFRGTANRATEPQLSPPPLVEAERPPPPKPREKKKKVEPAPPESAKPPPKKRPPPPPPSPPEEYGIIDYMREDFVHTTMTESAPLISEWFGRAAKVLNVIPGMQGVAKLYEGIADGFDGASLIYELAHELNQLDALEKGSKQLVKRTKPVKKMAEKLLKKKFPNLPEPARKKAAEVLEQLFEKYVTDPAIEGGKEKAKELDERKELDKPLFEELKKWLNVPQTATPAVTPGR